MRAVFLPFICHLGLEAPFGDAVRRGWRASTQVDGTGGVVLLTVAEEACAKSSGCVRLGAGGWESGQVGKWAVGLAGRCAKKVQKNLAKMVVFPVSLD